MAVPVLLRGAAEEVRERWRAQQLGEHQEPLFRALRAAANVHWHVALRHPRVRLAALPSSPPHLGRRRQRLVTGGRALGLGLGTGLYTQAGVGPRAGYPPG